MKALPVPALLAVLLAVVVTTVPAPVAAFPPEPVLPTLPPSPYPHTAIGAVVAANGRAVPRTGQELADALKKLDEFPQLPVNFSAVASHSGLARPRVAISSLSSNPPPPPPPSMRVVSTGGGWGSSAFEPLPTRTPASPLRETAPTEPHLDGRLFLAANTEADDRGNPVVTTVEFISWNSQRLKFDFGVIEGMGGGTPELKFLDGTRCFSCHKNRGPILGSLPWSNTSHNPAVRTAANTLIKFPSNPNPLGFGQPRIPTTEIDGMKLQQPMAPEVDASVRQAEDLLRDRATFQALVRTADGRQALRLLLGAVASKKPITDARAIRFDLNRLDLFDQVRSMHEARKTAPSGLLLDFSPAGSTPSAANLTKYDDARAGGKTYLPTAHQPSNPKAFAKFAPRLPTVASDLLTPLMLARAVGLSEGDRRFLVTTTEDASRRLGEPTLMPDGVAAKVFAGESFADVLKTGVLPGRDDFKDRFVAGVLALADARGVRSAFKSDRKTYTSGPAFDPSGAADKEVARLPSHACLSCHDVKGTRPAAFNPIPPLAFDPFDQVAREAWLKSADARTKAAVLGRFDKRIAGDKDMPPEDSTEAELFRAKNPDALNAIAEWVAAELKKAR